MKNQKDLKLNKYKMRLINKKTDTNKFFFNNKKAELEELLKIILWIAFFGIALVALYFLIRMFIY